MQNITLKALGEGGTSSARMPVFFIGHGNPMNALADNDFTRSLALMRTSLPEEPKAILVISAHWLTDGTRVSVTPAPRTIHDFGGFPEALFRMQYPAPGAPELARTTKGLVTSAGVTEDERWGLDHGAWSILVHMFPQARTPVFELSIDYRKPAQYHYDLASQLKPLRSKGVLIIGSGNIVHNLSRADFADGAAPFDWAVEFDETVKQRLSEHNYESLMKYESLGRAALLSVPTNDHYLPMFYTLGATDKSEPLDFTFEEIQNASISMRCFQIGR
jgi:4,5-DOPA dioxygenase extradiol